MLGYLYCVLDLMRDPTRRNVHAYERQVALDLLTVAECGELLAVLITDQVKLEFDEHVGPVEKEAAQAIKKLKAQVARVKAVASVYGGVGTANLCHLKQ